MNRLLCLVPDPQTPAVSVVPDTEIFRRVGSLLESATRIGTAQIAVFVQNMHPLEIEDFQHRRLFTMRNSANELLK
ncbi:hypothetical protein DFH06DRAFT_1352910 [Mycena polygramma]|nr:hypothetical protein DFH06DRAFT_1352910 [Mycena polygramma]